MEERTADTEIQLGCVILDEPKPPHTYLGVAENLMPGLSALLSGLPDTAPAITFISAHALECLLKAYLSRGGSDAAVRGKHIRHNLMELWKSAYDQALPIEYPCPAWVDQLGKLHKSPYFLRYSTDVHGSVSPDCNVLASALPSLLETVRENLKNP
jgi:hypothetical protein